MYDSQTRPSLSGRPFFMRDGGCKPTLHSRVGLLKAPAFGRKSGRQDLRYTESDARPSRTWAGLRIGWIKNNSQFLILNYQLFTLFFSLNFFFSKHTQYKKNMYIRHWAHKRASIFCLIYKWLNINILPPPVYKTGWWCFLPPFLVFFSFSPIYRGIVRAGTRNDKHDGHRRHNDADNVLSMG